MLEREERVQDGEAKPEVGRDAAEVDLLLEIAREQPHPRRAAACRPRTPARAVSDTQLSGVSQPSRFPIGPVRLGIRTEATLKRRSRSWLIT